MALNSWTTYKKAGDTIGIGMRIKHDSPETANKRVRVYYEAFYYRIGNYNWYENPYTTGIVTVNGSQTYNNSSQLVNLYSSTEHVVKTGNVWVSYNSDGTKSMAYDFTHDGSRTPPITAHLNLKGSYSLPNISVAPPAISRITSAPSSSTAGTNFTVSISSTSSAYTHSLYFSGGGISQVIGSRTGSGNIVTNVPSNLVTGTVSGILMIFTYSGSTQVSSHYVSHTVYKAIVYPNPTVSDTTVTDTSGNNVKAFSGANQLLMGLSTLRATVNASASSGASVNLYEVKLVNGSGTVRASATSSSSTVNLGALTYTISTSEVLNVVTRVRDTRGNWSSEKSQVSALRVHPYASPIVSGTASRDNSSLKVSYSWNAYSLKESGSTERNSLSIIVQTRPIGGTFVNRNTYTTSTDYSSNRTAILSGHDTTTGFDVRLVISDKVTSSIVNLNSVGTEAVPLDLSKGGAGVGVIHSGTGAHLQVGDKGINSLGPIMVNGQALDTAEAEVVYTSSVGTCIEFPSGFKVMYGKKSFSANVTTAAITFPKNFTSPPSATAGVTRVTSASDSVHAYQAIESTTTSGVTFNIGRALGNAYPYTYIVNYIAVGI